MEPKSKVNAGIWRTKNVQTVLDALQATFGGLKATGAQAKDKDGEQEQSKQKHKVNILEPRKMNDLKGSKTCFHRFHLPYSAQNMSVAFHRARSRSQTCDTYR
jgi:hypothetical protein